MENDFSDFLWNDKFKAATVSSLEQLHIQQQELLLQKHQDQHFAQQHCPANSSDSALYGLHASNSTAAASTSRMFGDQRTAKFSHQFQQHDASQSVKNERIPSSIYHQNQQDHQSSRQNRSPPPPAHDGGSKLGRTAARTIDARSNVATSLSSSTSAAAAAAFQSMCSANSRLHQPVHSMEEVVDSTTPPPIVHSVSGSSGLGSMVAGSSLSAVLAAVVSSGNDHERKAANSIRGNPFASNT